MCWRDVYRVARAVQRGCNTAQNGTPPRFLTACFRKTQVAWNEVAPQPHPVFIMVGDCLLL